MRRYNYITKFRDKHILEDKWLQEFYPNRVAMRVFEDAELGVKINGLTLRSVGLTYPELLQGK